MATILVVGDRQSNREDVLYAMRGLKNGGRDRVVVASTEDLQPAPPPVER